MKVGDWLWTCRAGFENDLCEELAVFKILAQAVQPALCVSRSRPMNPQNKLEPLELTFARQGLPVLAVCEAKAALIADLCIPQLRGAVAVQVFAPDSDEGNQLAAQVHGLLVTLSLRCCPSVADKSSRMQTSPAKRARSCFRSAFCPTCRWPLVCCTRAMRQPVSRRSAALQETQGCTGTLGLEADRGAVVEPVRSWRVRGDTCVDLGAAPGGWTQVLLERRCRVIR